MFGATTTLSFDGPSQTQWWQSDRESTLQVQPRNPQISQQVATSLTSLEANPSVISSTSPSDTVFVSSDATPATISVSTVTPSPSYSGPRATRVVLSLSTQITIPDYARFYTEPLASFHPKYFPLNDGSLVALPLIKDFRCANEALVLLGALIMLYLRNILLSGEYIRKGKVKKKTLFYVLLLSQLLAPAAILPFIISYFDEWVDCTVAVRTAAAAVSTSLGLLVTGILGVKAYRCLDDSRMVLAVLLILRISSSTVAVFNISMMKGERRLSGSCTVAHGKDYTIIMMILQLIELVFICLCFIYAIWKSHALPAARGRVSQYSLDSTVEIVPREIPEGAPAPRGWWDYVPKTEESSHPTNPPPISYEDPSLFSIISSKVRRFWRKIRKDSRPTDSAPPRKPSLHTEFPQPQPVPRPNRSRPSMIRIVDPVLDDRVRRRDAGAGSPTPSSLNRLVPSMVLFREVMKDELCYTAFITAASIGLVVAIVVGSANSKGVMSSTLWILVNWSLMSIITMHSFGRVVHRHEREAILQHPSAWDAAFRAEQVNAGAIRRRNTRRPWSPGNSSVSSRSRLRQPISPTETSEYGSPFGDPVPSLPRPDSLTPSWMSRGGRSGRSMSVTSSATSSSINTVDSLLRVPPDEHHNTILRSPMIMDEDTSPRNTIQTNSDISMIPQHGHRSAGHIDYIS